MGLWNDEFEGIGGSYVVKDGKRVPVVEKPSETPPVQKQPEPPKDEE